jgi:uncharacterized membrane protein (UPF0127 family)
VSILSSSFRAISLALALSGASVAVGGTALAQDGKAMMLPVDAAPLVAATSSGKQQFYIEIADDNSERERGLMFRRDMPDNRGMLFVFEASRPVGFWMKNTPMPLDMVFIRADGTIASIQQAEPFSEAVVSTPAPIRFVLELKAGTAAKRGLKEGDKLEHPVITAVAGKN